MGVHSTAPEPSENRHKNHQRERELSFEEALARYEPLYPQIDVRGSLTKFWKKGRLPVPRILEEWLDIERDARRKPKPLKPVQHDPEHWAEWRDQNYPTADKKIPFHQAPCEIQKEFLDGINGEQ